MLAPGHGHAVNTGGHRRGDGGREEGAEACRANPVDKLEWTTVQNEFFAATFELLRNNVPLTRAANVSIRVLDGI